MNLNEFEKKQLNDANKHYSEGRGKSTDSLRFEKYFKCLKKLNKFDTNFKVLDVGCGLGTLEEYLFKYGFLNVCAIDFSSVGIDSIKNKFLDYNFIIGDVKELDSLYKLEKFDLIFCCQVLEHIPDDRVVLKHMWNLLNNGGVLTISVPFEFNKRSNAHCNFYGFDTWNTIGNDLFNTKPIVLERFGEDNLQLLSIFIKENN